jgi:hypothetical protein
MSLPDQMQQMWKFLDELHKQDPEGMSPTAVAVPVSFLNSGVSVSHPVGPIIPYLSSAYTEFLKQQKEESLREEAEREKVRLPPFFPYPARALRCSSKRGSQTRRLRSTQRLH